jgi:AcrR family transcriptional regulator
MHEPSRATQSRSIQKRRRIIESTAKILAKKGYAQTTLSEIADDADAQAANIFYYFSSREELIKDVLLLALEQMHTTMSEVVENAEPGRPFIDLLKDLIRAVMMLTTSRDNYYGRAYIRAFNQVPSDVVRELNAKRHEIRALWARLIADAQAAGEVSADLDVDLATHLMLGATNWVSVWYKPSGSKSRSDIADRFVEMLIPALGVGAVSPAEAPAPSPQKPGARSRSKTRAG